jgi:CheY-like chemotaxis protein
MSEEVRRNALNPFFTTKEPGKGTGLGLGIVQSIATAAGGEVFIDSAPGAGTTVSIVLPALDEAPAAAGDRAPAAAGVGETILVVEDEERLRTLTERILASGGYNPVAAGSPREAIERAKGCNGDLALLLTDIVMPEMSGVDLAARLQGDHPQMAVAFMSGYAADQLASDHEFGGAPVYIEKPFDADALLSAVAMALDK